MGKLLRFKNCVSCMHSKIFLIVLFTYIIISMNRSYQRVNYAPAIYISQAVCCPGSTGSPPNCNCMLAPKKLHQKYTFSDFADFGIDDLLHVFFLFCSCL